MNYSEIKNKLNEQRKIALIEKDETKKSVISLLSSKLDLLNKELTLKGQEMTELEVIGILSSELKQTKETLTEAVRFDRIDAIAKAESQIKFIEQFLPKQLSEQEIIDYVNNKINDLKLEGPINKHFGLIMKNVSQELKGKADGKLISQIVKNIISK